MSDNPYVPPEASTARALDVLVEGNLQSGLDGRYEFSIDRIWSHAWKSIRGAKAPIFVGMLIFMAASVAISEALALVNLNGQVYLEQGDFIRGYLLTIASGIIMSPITVPLMAGIYMMGARRAAGREVRIGDVFAHFDKLVPLVVMSVMSTVLMYVGFIFCLLPGLYLAVGYSLAIPLLVDKGLSPWEALETSRKAIHHRWLSVFLFFLGTSIVGTLASVPIVTILWSLPWMMVCFGALYVTVFGLGQAGETAA